MNRILAGLQAFSDDKKWVLLLIAVILTVVYAVITIFSMAKLTALTMLLFMHAQGLLLLAVLCYLVVIITTRESITREHYEPGHVIFHQGDMGKQVYVVISGEVEVVRQEPEAEETVIARLGAGEFFGEMALIREAPRVATVRTINAVEVLVMQRGSFLSLFTHLPSLRQSFEQVAQQRKDELQAMATQKN